MLCFDYPPAKMDTPYSVEVVEETDSTQDDARALYRGRAVLVVAARQRKGRGRAGSRWTNAPRALAASLAFEPGWRPDRLTVLPLVAGVAAARVTGCDLKWPNDLLEDDRKVGGILVEASEGLVVCGMGLNLWWPHPPEGVGGLFDDDPGPDLGEDLARRWARQLLDLAEQGPAAWPIEEYRSRCVTIGRSITWKPDGVGVATDVAADGSLVVDTDRGRVDLRWGEVRHVRDRRVS